MNTETLSQVNPGHVHNDKQSKVNGLLKELEKILYGRNT